MSDTVVKSVRKSSRPGNVSATSKSRKLAATSARSKSLSKSSTTKKAPVRKATKPKAASSTGTKGKDTKKQLSRPASQTGTKKRSAVSASVANAGKSKSAARPIKKEAPKKASATRAASKPTTAATSKQTANASSSPARVPTRDEAAALHAFEQAHKEFARGHFTEASRMFRQLIERYPKASEVIARSRTYLSVAETRMHSERGLPRDADSLYDRGVVELNRGEYIAAQEMFERALKREPASAHVHYGLAATRARLGSVGSALESLERALDLQPNLRSRAQHDQDLAALRNEPDFERLIFAARS
jgi:tetratricopeptide (TPR) repeat protein